MNRIGTFCAVFMCTLFLLLVVVANENGCVPVVSRSSLVGTYQLRRKQQTLELVMAEDGTFTETMRESTGKQETRSGKWMWKDHTVIFDDLWVPQPFLPAAMKLENDSSAWSVTPSYRWGTVVLNLFSDEDEGYFKKVL